jgi:MFS family permease
VASWIVLAALALSMMAGTGLRSVFGVYIKPMEADFGWSRSALSGAAAVSLLVFGAVGPLAGRLADHWGPRRVVTLALVLLGLGTVGSAFVRELWHVYVTAGLFTALGSGALRHEHGPVEPEDRIGDFVRRAEQDAIAEQFVERNA